MGSSLRFGRLILVLSSWILAFDVRCSDVRDVRCSAANRTEATISTTAHHSLPLLFFDVGCSDVPMFSPVLGSPAFGLALPHTAQVACRTLATRSSGVTRHPCDLQRPGDALHRSRHAGFTAVVPWEGMNRRLTNKEPKNVEGLRTGRQVPSLRRAEFLVRQSAVPCRNHIRFR